MSEKEIQLKVYPIFTILGGLIIMAVFVIGAAILAPTANSYFGDNTKQTRDSASEGSDLLNDLKTLQTIPRWLRPFTFFGVTLFMFGIALEFSVIPNLLKIRGEVIKNAFPKIVEHGGK